VRVHTLRTRFGGPYLTKQSQVLRGVFKWLHHVRMIEFSEMRLREVIVDKGKPKTDPVAFRDV
jgi:hypothetical protein